MYESKEFVSVQDLDQWLNGRGKSFDIVGYAFYADDGTLWVTIKYK